MRDPAKVMAALGFFATVAYVARGAFQLAARWIDSRRDGIPVAAVEDRLARIEQAVDAIAIEVERIAEHQRYASMLAERSAPAPRQLGMSRSVTPH